MAQVLTPITEEATLAPGAIVELRCKLVTTNTYAVAGYLADMEPRLLKEEPLWQYLGYEWDPDGKVIAFRMKLRQYQMDIETREIIPLDPVTMQPLPDRYTMYYASGAYLKALYGLVIAAVAAFTWAMVDSMTVYLTEVEKTKQAEAVINDPSLSPEQKVEAVKSLGAVADTTVIGEAVKAAGGTFAVLVVLTLAYIVFGRK